MKITKTREAIFAGLFVLFIAVVFLAPAAPFTIDDTIYIAMAEAMAERGSLYVNPPLAIAEAPILLESVDLIHRIDGNAVPQYPAGYAFLAAPFFLVFGIHGLILMNAISGAFCLWLTYLIANTLYNDRMIARNATLILGVATFFGGYVFSIWPHITSLAFTLGGAYLVLRMPQSHHRLVYALLAGLLFGLSVNIRIDGIIPAIAAFFWLRFFARPDDRLSAIALITGLAPGLVLAAYLNFLKFGVFQPFHYGQTDGLATASRYIPIVAAGGIAIILSLAINVAHPTIARVINFRRLVYAALVVLAIGLVAAGSFLIGLGQGTYNLVVDMQAFDPAKIRPGIIKDEFGYWSFWGIPKKALLQSLPFATLLLIPIYEFCRAQKISAHSFSFLMIAGTIAFFAMNAWHGGMTFNMRYFLPAVPFIAITASYGLAHLLAEKPNSGDLILRSIIVGAALAMFFYYALPDIAPSLAIPAQLYPQLAIATALIASLVYVLYAHKNATIALVLSSLAFGYAGILSAADAAGELGLRFIKAPYDQAYKRAITPGSLVVTVAEDHMVETRLNGVILARAQEKELSNIREAINQYERAGRCVYLHTPVAYAMVGDTRFEAWTVKGAPTHQGNILDLYGLPAQAATCKPQ
ncbi:ArnT family glycosyltransferase [Hyphococcus sp. DH-69]|uniref:ArnT family glycosyltransferase n=1 Tax=Hyphococcus formosus TaxID=3143534 RepID=UPI00398AA01D